jgi:hypothetical protein
VPVPAWLVYTRRNGGFIKPDRGKGYEVVIVSSVG